MGRDTLSRSAPPNGFIAIHPPLAGRDLDREIAKEIRKAFQSTRPLRGGTILLSVLRSTLLFQSTRPLRGGTCSCSFNSSVVLFQSTRPLRGGTMLKLPFHVIGRFQSPRPLRGGTELPPVYLGK